MSIQAERVSGALVALMAAAMLLAGCGSTGGDQVGTTASPPSTTSQVTGDSESTATGDSSPSPAALPFGTRVLDPGAARDQALLEGRLNLVDGCLVLVADPAAPGRSSETYALVLPDTAGWDGHELTFGDGTYRPGDAISFGGGGGAVDRAEVWPKFDLPESCPGDLVWYAG